eukprot:5100916-Amphidinium_carterae.2
MSDTATAYQSPAVRVQYRSSTGRSFFAPHAAQDPIREFFTPHAFLVSGCKALTSVSRGSRTKIDRSALASPSLCVPANMIIIQRANRNDASLTDALIQGTLGSTLGATEQPAGFFLQQAKRKGSGHSQTLPIAQGRHMACCMV